MPTATKAPPRPRSPVGARRPTTATPPPRRPQAARASLTAPQTRPRPPVRSRRPPVEAPRRATRPEQRHPSGAARPGARRRLGIVIVCAVALVLTIVGFHAFLAQNQVQLDRMREDIVVAESRYDEARLENSELSSPARITEEAIRIGLGVPEVAPTAVPVSGAVPKRGIGSDVMPNYEEVKRHLDASP